MSEKERIEAIVNQNQAAVDKFKPDQARNEGKLGALDQIRDSVRGEYTLESTVDQLALITSRHFMELTEDVNDLMRLQSAWTERVERESKETLQMLLTFLGLKPDATREEIREAVDDVGDIIAGYRRKKRGT